MGYVGMPFLQQDLTSVKRINKLLESRRLRESGVKGMKWGVHKKGEKGERKKKGEQSAEQRGKWVTSRGDKIDYRAIPVKDIDYYRAKHGNEVVGAAPITKDDLTNSRIFNASKPGCSLFMDMVLNSGFWGETLPKEEYASIVDKAKKAIASLPKSSEALVKRAKIAELTAFVGGGSAAGGLDVEVADAKQLLVRKYGNRKAVEALDRVANKMVGDDDENGNGKMSYSSSSKPTPDHHKLLKSEGWKLTDGKGDYGGGKYKKEGAEIYVNPNGSWLSISSQRRPDAKDQPVDSGDGGDFKSLRKYLQSPKSSKELFGRKSSKESAINDWKKSVLGHHQDIMVDPRVREGGR